MLIVGFSGIIDKLLVEKYPNNIVILQFDTNNITNESLIEYIENIKEKIAQYDIVIIPYVNEIVLCLDTLSINYLVVYPTELDTQSMEVVDNKVEETPPAIDKKNLTLQELIEHDVDITEADIRDLKSTTNKFKVAMLLQAKSRLNTVLKLCNVLDKLYDELVDRIDQSLETTDTPSLMYTTDYIAKALSETNQFIMSLITNEKIQNFFIIDNSNIINITDNRVDIDKREKIRKAAEIVLDNADYFTAGQYDKVIDPNTVFEDGKENSDGNTAT